MDAFGYHAAAGLPLNGYNIPMEAPRGDGWSPHRDELAGLLRRLRARYPRRRLFRVNDVENVIRQLRWPHQLGFMDEEPRRIFFGPAPVEEDHPYGPISPAPRHSRAVRVRRTEVIDLTGDSDMEA